MEADAADHEEASSLALGEVVADKAGDDLVALDPLQEARKRRQMLAELAANNKADSEVEDPLQWWICHAADYPVLSQMAFDLFTYQKVITDERNRLSSNTVAAIECQKHLLRSGMLS
ncbi:hypothetical protein HRG_003396 [Hirsutella rhossiliensis]|uniref:HAT C-terminal dimerisation domain-containing protein n=1 Tax=Hirsutella rhossiliensis TaxID=111463 RepID=A0A9P8N1X6_9HYPO|nr:uncharacterized protein HRG_03396 [Hirsutella rhossiliensis]KAH0965380.1 hypothetical protein HRG_03396 [Hirsutella rhossiliensis]